MRTKLAPSIDVDHGEPRTLATKPPSGLQDWIKPGDARGDEAIERGDVKLPLLRVCQALAPQRVESDARYLAGLQEGDLFNDLTGEIYGRGPLPFVVVRFDKRGVQFGANYGDPIVDMNVPLDDPRMAFETIEKDGAAVRVKPRATLFYDYTILILRESAVPELIVFSLKTTQLKKGREFNSRRRMLNGPAWAGTWTVKTIADKKDAYNFRGVVIEPVGLSDRATCDYAERLYEGLKGKRIAVDRADDFVDASGETRF